MNTHIYKYVFSASSLFLAYRTRPPVHNPMMCIPQFQQGPRSHLADQPYISSMLRHFSVMPKGKNVHIKNAQRLKLINEKIRIKVLIYRLSALTDYLHM